MYILFCQQLHIVVMVLCHRFMYHSGGSKLEIPVEFPMELDPKEVCPDMIDEAPPLHLVAMVCHFGSKLFVHDCG